MAATPHMKRLLPAMLAIALAAFALGLLLARQFAPASSPPAAAPAAAQRLTLEHGLTVLTLTRAVQRVSGVRTALLAAANDDAQTPAYGTVLDVQPLLALRAQFDAAQADAAAARVAVTASRQAWARSRALYRDQQNMSLKSMQAAQAQYRTDQVRADAAAQAVQAIRDQTRQAFGATLAQWALVPRSAEFQRLRQRQDALLRVTLPLDAAPAAPAVPVHIQVLDDGNRRLPATLVSRAPQSDPAIPGEAWFYRVASPLQSGSRVSAYLPAPSRARRGVLIPADAVVWYGGQAWAYVQIGAERFGRYPVASNQPVPNGYFVRDGFSPGQRVVVVGAQLLMSEELRPPPGGSGCKDPECD
jgi:hypothetical protein